MTTTLKDSRGKRLTEKAWKRADWYYKLLECAAKLGVPVRGLDCERLKRRRAVLWDADTAEVDRRYTELHRAVTDEDVCYVEQAILQSVVNREVVSKK